MERERIIEKLNQIYDKYNVSNKEAKELSPATKDEYSEVSKSELQTLKNASGVKIKGGSWYNNNEVTIKKSLITTTRISAKKTNSYFEEVYFETTNFEDISFVNSIFVNCQFSNCHFKNANFENAVLSGCVFVNTEFEEGSFKNALIVNTNIENINLSDDAEDPNNTDIDDMVVENINIDELPYFSSKKEYIPNDSKNSNQKPIQESSNLAYNEQKTKKNTNIPKKEKELNEEEKTMNKEDGILLQLTKKTYNMKNFSQQDVENLDFRYKTFHNCSFDGVIFDSKMNIDGSTVWSGNVFRDCIFDIHLVNTIFKESIFDNTMFTDSVKNSIFENCKFLNIPDNQEAIFDTIYYVAGSEDDKKLNKMLKLSKNSTWETSELDKKNQKKKEKEKLKKEITEEITQEIDQKIKEELLKENEDEKLELSQSFENVRKFYEECNQIALKQRDKFKKELDDLKSKVTDDISKVDLLHRMIEYMNGLDNSQKFELVQNHEEFLLNEIYKEENTQSHIEEELHNDDNIINEDVEEVEEEDGEK